MNRRVLVTGSHGFIGRWVAAELEARGDECVPYDHPCTIMLGSYLRGSMEHVDAVINLAGVLGTAETIGSERYAAEVNILGALNVYEAAHDVGIPVVQIATGHRGQLNPYAITKACAEDLALSRAEWLGQPVAVVRAFHVYGAGQKAPPPHGPAQVRKIVPSFVCRALAGMPLEVNGSGHQRIDLVWAGDVAKVLVDAIDGPYGQVLDAGTGHGTTVNECARTIIAACESTSELVHVPMRSGEPDFSTVVAHAPLVTNLWPYRLADTVDAYQALVKVPA